MGDRAYVALNGRRHYLGNYGSPESHREYERVLAEWRACGGQPPVGAELTVVELLGRFWQYAERTYQNRGTLENFKYALRPLRELYGDKRVDDLGARALKAVRQSMVDRGVSRAVDHDLLDFSHGSPSPNVHAGSRRRCRRGLGAS